MPGIISDLAIASLDNVVVRLLLATVLGMVLGLEREWSEKPAGIRTFSLISLLGAMFAILGQPVLVAVGGLLLVAHGILLAVQGLREEEGLVLTTSVSMLIAYGVGTLVASQFILEGVAVAVISSFLLILKRELHSFAWGLSHDELRSAIEFAILAFVIFPLLPEEETVRLGDVTFDIEPQIVWLMVVFIAGIGIVNYVIVNTYGGRGIVVTGFFGGMVSSTAVVGTVVDHLKQHPDATSYGVAAILLADAAMALRNLVIAIAFTFPDTVLFTVGLPLGVVVLGSFAIAAASVDWSEEFELDLESPFSLRYALGFGGLYLLIIVFGTLANATFGNAGFYATSALSGLVSSAGATTSAVVLYRGGAIEGVTASVGILLATAASIVVKAGIVVPSSNRGFVYRVAGWSALLITAAALSLAGSRFF